MRAIDYSSLSQPVVSSDIEAITSLKPKSGHWSFAVLAGVAVVIGFIYTAVNIFSGSDGNVLTKLVFASVWFVPVGLLFGYVAYAAKRRNTYLAKLYKFAVANAMTFRYDTQPTGLNGMIFNEGHSRKINEVISSPDGYEIGNFEYVTGSGKNSQTHTFGFVRVALSRHLPNMVLDARTNNFWKFSNLPDSFDRSQRLQLEGNFNDHFDLYVPKQYERDALYVFTPDVMQALIDHGSQYDMEVVDNQLYMYRSIRHDLASPKLMADVVGMIAMISNQVTHQTSRYSDERVADNQSGQVVSAAGQRLKKGINPLVIVIVVAVILQLVLQVMSR